MQNQQVKEKKKKKNFINNFNRFEKPMKLVHPDVVGKLKKFF